MKDNLSDKQWPITSSHLENYVNNYGPEANLISAPQASHSILMKIVLQLLDDLDTRMFIEHSMRGGLPVITNRHQKAKKSFRSYMTQMFPHSSHVSRYR